MGELKETAKIIAKTDPTGKVDLEPVEPDVAARLNGTTIIDGDNQRIKVKDTGKTVSEAEIEDETLTLNQEDTLNLGNDLANVVKDTLRQHGDAVATVRATVNKAEKYLAVYVTYEKNADNPGKPSEDIFKFVLKDGKVVLDNDGKNHDICGLDRQSGTVSINKDLAKNSLMKFLKDNTAVMEKQEEGSENLLLGFMDAVNQYRKHKTGENIKNVLRAANNFSGNSLSSKLRSAIQQAKQQKSVPETENISEVVYGDTDTDLLYTIMCDFRDKLEEFQNQVTTYGRNANQESIDKLHDAINPLKQCLDYLCDSEDLGDLYEISGSTLAKASQKAYDAGRDRQASNFADYSAEKVAKELNVPAELSSKVRFKPRLAIVLTDDYAYRFYTLKDSFLYATVTAKGGTQEKVKLPLNREYRFRGPQAKRLARIVADWYKNYSPSYIVDHPIFAQLTDWHNWVAL